MRTRDDKIEALLGPAEVAAWLDIPLDTLYQWRHRGLGPPSMKVGRHLRYRRRDIERWLDQLCEGLR